jgi:hypothetical protein
MMNMQTQADVEVKERKGFVECRRKKVSVDFYCSDDGTEMKASSCEPSDGLNSYSEFELIDLNQSQLILLLHNWKSNTPAGGGLFTRQCCCRGN